MNDEKKSPKKEKITRPKGRPVVYDPEFHIPDFLKKSRQGKDLTQIAASWDLCRSTVYDWKEKYTDFSYAVRKGRELCEAWYKDIGQMAMLGKVVLDGKAVKVDLGWHRWMAQNVCKWSSEKITTEHTGKDGEPIQVNTSNVSEKKLKAMLEKVRTKY